MAADLKQTRTQLKGKLIREIRKIREAIEDDFAVSEVRRSLDKLNTTADALEAVHEQYVTAASLGDDGDEAAYLKQEISRARQTRRECNNYFNSKSRPTAPPVAPSTKIKLKSMDYPMFDGKARNFQEWKSEYQYIMKPRLVGASEAGLAMCIKACLPKEVKSKLSPDCKSEAAIMKEMERQYGVKVVNQIIEDVLKLGTPTQNDPVNVPRSTVPY